MIINRFGFIDEEYQERIDITIITDNDNYIILLDGYGELKILEYNNIKDLVIDLLKTKDKNEILKNIILQQKEEIKSKETIIDILAKE